MEEQDALNKAINEIKKKKELSGLSSSLVEDALLLYLKKNNLDISRFNVLSSRDKSIFIKEIRSQLRLSYGRFQFSTKNRQKMLDSDNISSLLDTHSSTKERIVFYPELKSLLLKLKVKSILDLGCGLNPIALASKNIEYFASDINEADLSVIESFFSKNKIAGKVFFYDLNKFNSIDMPSTDITLIFKVFDILKKRGYYLIEKILTGVPSKLILVSFSTKKLSGKSMNKPKREWFESTLAKLQLEYKVIKTENEIFYLIEK